ncbi:hypothetical protein RhiirC2_797799 [Rhizophagus irregularis]|uniref:MULE transposase domain-containing protein n=1 Tax=Rhizophagus irregularis TaxID=588596 RepID=A0A2N1M7E8_9GLOM|nr:hypothetical protein RhiirC2_797799 [Rhizophagus irregularis]
MELDWESFINFPKDIEDVLTSPPNFFIESDVNCNIEDTIISPNDNIFIELEVELINPIIDNTNTFNYSNNNSNFSIYQYNLHIGDMFDDWMSVDKFMYNYCLKREFGYQIYRNDKDINDHSIIWRKSFRCSLNDSHNHELNSAQIAHLNASRYRQFNDDMMQDLAFFTDCKVALIVQLEILKKKYPEHVFHKQDIYNLIYKLHGNNKDENLDSGLLLNVLFEKMTEDSNWKVFVQNSANALVENEMTSTYIWILKCLMEATDKTIPKAFWTDSESCLINAAFHVFPTTPYFYCLFHIWQNIIKHLKNKLDKAFPSFIGLNRQFNAGIQSTQSVESFNGIIKKAVNSTSSLCNVEKAINKRHNDES